MRAVWKIGLTCTAAGLLVAVVGLSLRPRAGFAEVTTAFLRKPFGSICEPRWPVKARANCGTRPPGPSWRHGESRLDLL